MKTSSNHRLTDSNPLPAGPASVREVAPVDSCLLTDEELHEVVGAIVANDLGPDNVQKKHVS